jgi:hypothetical protein
LRGRHALTVFPEGNVYLQNDVVTPFHEGAAFLGLRSAKTLAEQNARVLAVPVGIKVTHLHDVRELLTGRIHALADALGASLSKGDSPLDKLRQIGLAALARNLRYRGYDVPESPQLADLVGTASQAVIGRLEAKMALSPRASDGLIDRIRRARRVIHEIRADEARAHEHVPAAHWADEAMLAFRIASYAGNYVQSRPTVDRIAETVEKLSEDLYNRAPPPLGRRLAMVRFGEPIDLSDELAAHTGSPGGKFRDLAGTITERAEQAVQQGVDQLNAANGHAGGKLWSA